MRSSFWVRGLLGLTLALQACGTQDAAFDATDGSTSDATETAMPGCRPAPGTTGNPQTISEAVALLNGLPQPVTLPCLLESLDRPLALVATTNIVSAQPAESARNPRVFLLTGRLSLALVPDGLYRDVLEFGEISSDNQNSIKGEVDFPIQAPLAASAPFDRIIDGESAHTTCSGCHYPERTADKLGYPRAFESIAYRPNPLYASPLEDLQHEHETCDTAAEPERCATLKAIFGHGAVVGGAFPAEMPIFF